MCILKLQVNYILQTLEKMAELKVNTIEPRFFTDEHFLRLSFFIPGKIVRLTSKVKWVTGLKDGTSQPSAGSFIPSVFIHLHVHCTGPGTRTFLISMCTAQVLVQEQPGNQLHPLAGEPAAVLVDDPRPRPPQRLQANF